MPPQPCSSKWLPDPLQIPLRCLLNDSSWLLLAAPANFHKMITLNFLSKISHFCYSEIRFDSICNQLTAHLDCPGCSCLLLSTPGCSWLLLAARDRPGCSWLLLSAPGCSWLLLAAPGCFWLLLAAPGCCSWLLPAAPGCSRLPR